MGMDGMGLPQGWPLFANTTYTRLGSVLSSLKFVKEI